MKKTILIVALLCFASSTIQAFSITNIQYLYGNFNGNSGFDTHDGGKHTITLENFSTYKYGDFFGFVDFARADEKFKNYNKSSDIYFELCPRISLSKVSASSASFLFVKDIFLSGQYNRQLHKYEDFEALLYGVGADFNIKGFDVLGLNLYKKNKNFGDNTYQISANYMSGNILGTNLTFNGFTDYTKEDLLSQNKLLYKLSYSPLKSTIHVGSEWHYYRVKDSDIKSNVLQAVVMITFMAVTK
jgi:nucleoside-specific outer membrane channel protein Tsx